MEIKKVEEICGGRGRTIRLCSDSRGPCFGPYVDIYYGPAGPQYYYYGKGSGKKAFAAAKEYYEALQMEESSPA